MDNSLQELLQKAKEAAQTAYAPYSGFKVGAALKTALGNIYTAANVENSSYSLTSCAERNAVFQAVNKGDTAFTDIAIYVDADKLFSPCGACRQVLSEFAPDMRVVFASHTDTVETTLKELLPYSFCLKA
jgi:cytidine deaminase